LTTTGQRAAGSTGSNTMKTANKSFQASAETYEREWFVVDATDKVLGRLAVRLATVLTGKHKPTYTPHVDTGDFVIVLNADKVKVTGRKKETRIYQNYTGYPSGLKEWTMQEVLDRSPGRVLRDAVRRMMPKNALAARMLVKLKLYPGDTHPHQAQMPQPLPNC
jgi:large subunit ribosomal protein L13